MSQAEGPSAGARVYGVVLGFAVLGGAVAIHGALGGDEEPPPAAAHAPREAPEPDERGAFVPQLPAVPNLATEPPPARPAPADPRLAQLTVEMRYLSRARELLADHPAQALGVLDEHRRRHPDGVLREEREAFVVEALLALDRDQEAERRYYDFVRDFPDSAFLARLEAMMRR